MSTSTNEISGTTNLFGIIFDKNGNLVSGSISIPFMFLNIIFSGIVFFLAINWSDTLKQWANTFEPIDPQDENTFKNQKIKFQRELKSSILITIIIIILVIVLIKFYQKFISKNFQNLTRLDI